MKKIKFLFSGNFELSGRDSHFEKGAIVEAEDADADRLILGLCAEEVTEEQPARKTKKAVSYGG